MPGDHLDEVRILLALLLIPMDLGFLHRIARVPRLAELPR
jgi:hypothetical protein